MEVNRWWFRPALCALSLNVRLSVGVQPLAEGNSQGHDQGFLAIPFIEELKM